MEDVLTRAALFATGAAMAVLTWLLLAGDDPADLPFESLLVAAGTIAAAIGVGVGLTGPSRERLQWFGSALMVYAAIRGSAFAIRTADRTTGAGEWLDQSTAVWVWSIVFAQGFLVWVRAHREPYREVE